MWRLKYKRGYFKVRIASQFSYLFTLKNAHLSSNSSNFGMQANTAMKFAECGLNPPL